MLPVAWCDACHARVLVHRAVPDGADPMTADLVDRCVDCGADLGGRGLAIAAEDLPIAEVERLGYRLVASPGE